jgi:hypothetical protein
MKSKGAVLFLPLVIGFFSANGYCDPVTPPNNPGNAAGSTEFNWQDLWGTIHINSFADGLKDPGAPTTDNGSVGLSYGGWPELLKDYPMPTPNPSRTDALQNGIKYDIKNSVVNCMSRAVPTWPILHLEAPTGYGHNYSDNNVCIDTLPTRVQDNKRTVLFLPIWDPRSNSLHDENSGSTNTGCVQQLVNRCVTSMYDCKNETYTTGPGYKNPISHVFSEQDVAAFGGAGSSLPSIYYRYTKVLETAPRATNMPELPSSGYYLDPETITYDCSTWHDRTTTEVANRLDCEMTIAESIKGVCESEVITTGSVPTGTTEVTTGSVTTGTTAVITGSVASGPATVTSTAGECNCRYSDWQNNSCTSFNYTRVTSSTFALSISNPPTEPYVPSSQANIEAIDVSTSTDYTDHLSRLKTYEVTNNEVDFDVNGFIIVDPKNFFDLNLYKDGGTYDSNYNDYDTTAKSSTPGTCPIYGLVNGYNAICDSEAGCNLPIYGKGTPTEFTDIGGNTLTYNNHSLKWSGYVKKWAFITAEEYLANISSRKNLGNYRTYKWSDGLNSNPILMITRLDEYCEDRELVSGKLKFQFNDSKAKIEKDMPCIQYMQYQYNSTTDEYTFVDLFEPAAEPEETPMPFFSVKYNYNLDAHEKPISAEPVEGSGPSLDVVVSGTLGGKYLSFMDIGRWLNIGSGSMQAVRFARYTEGDPVIDPSTGLNTAGLVRRSNPSYQALPNEDQRNQMTAGVYLGYDPVSEELDTSKGTGIRIKPGTSVSIRLLEAVNVDVGSIDSTPTCETIKSTSTKINTGRSACIDCLIITNGPQGKEIFISTNDTIGFQSFVTAGGINHQKIPNVSIRKCDSWYQAGAGTEKPNLATTATAPIYSNGTDSWVGKLSCDELTVKPECNHTKVITAQRYCQLENGTRGNCDDCYNSDETAFDRQFSDKLKAKVELKATNPTDTSWQELDEDGMGMIVSNPFDGSGNKCYFSALCMAPRSAGCPPPGGVGHIFCLAPETKIQMADGSEKNIDQIKAGESVVAFKAKHSKHQKLRTAKVIATAITQNQKIIKIDDLKITPLHKIIMASGRGVMAKKIKVGDKILRADGTVKVVQKIENDSAPIEVFNLVLEEGADGYIANGLRVLSYPIMKGLLP